MSHFAFRREARGVRHISALLVGLVMWCAPSLSAQAPPLFTANYNDGCLPILTSSTPFSLSPSTCASTQVGGGGLFVITSSVTKAARATYTSLGAYASINYSIDSGGPISISNGPKTYVYVQASDFLTFSGGTGAGVFRVTQRVQGSFSDNAVGVWGPSSNSIDTYSYLGSGGGSGPVFFYAANGDTFPGSNTSVMDFAFTFGETRTLERNLILGTGWLGAGGVGPVGYAATADFLNSADFSYEVLDDQLNPLASAYVVGSDGTQYVVAQAIVPEPASLLLLTTGLLSVFGFASRRRAINKATRTF